MSVQNFEFADHVLGFMIREKLTEEVLEDIHNKIDATQQEGQPLSIYLEFCSDDTPDYEVLYNALKHKLSNPDKFHRFAIVSDKNVMSLFALIQSLFTGTEVKKFDRDSRLEALQWVSCIG